MQTKLLNIGDLKKIHFTINSIAEANEVKNELQEMGFKILLFKIKERMREKNANITRSYRHN